MPWFLQITNKWLVKHVEKLHELHEMAILETLIFKNFWGGMPPKPPEKLVPLALAISACGPLNNTYDIQHFGLSNLGSKSKIDVYGILGQ